MASCRHFPESGAATFPEFTADISGIHNSDAPGGCSSAVFNGVEYQVHFEGIRQVNLITDARVGVGPAAFAEISYSKFELASPHQLERLLDNQNCLVKLLPASFCNLQVPDSA